MAKTVEEGEEDKTLSSSRVAREPRVHRTTKAKVRFAPIRKAMESPKYAYRTIEGVAKEAKLTINAVETAIAQHSSEVVILHRRGAQGQRLVTTRKHYEEKASIGDKLKGVLLNRVY